MCCSYLKKPEDVVQFVSGVWRLFIHGVRPLGVDGRAIVVAFDSKGSKPRQKRCNSYSANVQQPRPHGTMRNVYSVASCIKRSTQACWCALFRIYRPRLYYLGAGSTSTRKKQSCWSWQKMENLQDEYMNDVEDEQPAPRRRCGPSRMYYAIMAFLFAILLLIAVISLGTFGSKHAEVRQVAKDQGAPASCILFGKKLGEENQLGDAGFCAFVLWGQVSIAIVFLVWLIFSVVLTIIGPKVYVFGCYMLVFLTCHCREALCTIAYYIVSNVPKSFIFSWIQYDIDIYYSLPSMVITMSRSSQFFLLFFLQYIVTACTGSCNVYHIGYSLLRCQYIAPCWTWTNMWCFYHSW